MTGVTVDDDRLPPLRADLRLLRGPAGRDGSPSWTILDPARNRYFRIGWAEFEMLARWRLGRAQAVAGAVSAETTLSVSVGHVRALIDFLGGSGLLRADDGEGWRRLQAAAKGAGGGWWRRLMHHYLFIRLPLLRPDRFLGRALPMVAPFYGQAFWTVIAVIGLVGLFLAARQWDAFVATFMRSLTPAGLAWYFAALALVKTAHEFGHAFTAKRFGCRVPRMGLALVLLWPVCYADTSDAWKLISRRQRLAIGVAGVAIELAIAAVATLAWSLLDDGPARMAAFLLATTGWITTLAVNLNPLMRFDGYYVLSDLLDLENLQARSFAVARWWLRETLFGFGDPPPEPLPDGRRRFLLIYGLAAWIYRLVLLAVIALAVYHFLFKLAGLALAAVELGWLLLRPVWGELRVWWAWRRRMTWNRRSAGAAAAGLALLALLVLPWQGTVKAPAMLESAARAALFAPVPARVVAVLAAEGDEVAEGQTLVTLTSPDLELAMAKAEGRIAALRWQIEHLAAGRDAEGHLPVLRRQLAMAETELRGLREQASRLRLEAPLAGRVVALDDGLRPGRWYGVGTRLAEVAAVSDATVVAYLAEEDLARVMVGAEAEFHSDAGPVIPGRVIQLETVAVARLPHPHLGEPFGGTIPVRADSDPLAPVPTAALYRAVIAPAAAGDHERMVKGWAAIDGAPVSPLAGMWRKVAEVVLRESGF